MGFYFSIRIFLENNSIDSINWILANINDKISKTFHLLGLNQDHPSLLSLQEY